MLWLEANWLPTRKVKKKGNHVVRNSPSTTCGPPH